MFYKQRLNDNSFRVVETLKWTNKQVMLEDVKSGLVYVITWDSFFPFHEELIYEPAEIFTSAGSKFGDLMKRINNDL